MQRLLEILERIRSPRILVFGDLVLDRYVEGSANRVSPEAPVLVFEAETSSYRLGGAGNVAANVTSVGGRASCAGLVGKDSEADKLLELLAAAAVSSEAVIVDPLRPTTVKTRFVSKTHQVLRVDEESKLGAGEQAERELSAFLDRHLEDFDAVILSDYGKGVLTNAVLTRVIAQARAVKIPILVDPKGSDFVRYRGATLITPNKDEAEAATGKKIESEQDLHDAAEELMATAELESIVITLGKEGIFFRNSAGEKKRLPTEARAVFDVTGAGDTVVALLATCLGSGVDLEDAVRIANIGAGIVVGRVGTASITRDELLGVTGVSSSGKILDDASLSRVLVDLEKSGKRSVFTNGCFDLLHPGHLDYLEKARAYGDCLILGINTDASVRKLKGKERPILPLKDRLLLLAGLEVVDYLIPFDEDDPLELIERISPHVLAKGEDWREKGVVGREWVEARGGQVVLLPLLPGYSTTEIIERIQGLGGGTAG